MIYLFSRKMKLTPMKIQNKISIMARGRNGLMSGQVYVEYRRLGFFAVQTEDNYFSIIEVQSNLPSLGNKLIGELNSLGEKSLYNETTKEELKVSIKSTQLTLVEAKSYIKKAVRGI